jgi:3'(2'), 5'-bisphosphate nucleotidase
VRSIELTFDPEDRPRLLQHVVDAARDAGAQIMRLYGERGGWALRLKDDRSPVTQADERAEALIVGRLEQLSLPWPIVAEEAAAAGRAPQAADRFWLVDPLDGTKEFIGGNGEFTVNIALIEGGVPVLGVVYAPAIDRLFAGIEGQGASCEQGGVRRDIACREAPAEGLTVVASRSHGDAAALEAWLASTQVARVVGAGSSLKFCLVACGEADSYPRLGPTMEWDTAAGHAVLLAAGGDVFCLSGQALRYGKPGYRNPHFVARPLHGPAGEGQARRSDPEYAR